MTTIYIPRADYLQCADDEGRDYLAFRTIYAAAARWVEAGRQWETTGPDEGVALVFAERTGDDVHLCIVHPDDDMEGLYPAAALPFTITPQPFKVGDWVRPEAAVDDFHSKQVTDVRDDGVVAIGTGGIIRPSDYALWMVVPAPTRTFTVRVRADHSIDDVYKALASLEGDPEVTSA